MINVEPIAFVHKPCAGNPEAEAGTAICWIELDEPLATSSYDGLEDFSHVEVIYHRIGVSPGGDAVADAAAGRPLGVLARLHAGRPNGLESAIARVRGRRGRLLEVEDLDVADGTAVLDIKPVMAELLPREEIRQPVWSRTLMRDYERLEAGADAGIDEGVPRPSLVEGLGGAFVENPLRHGPRLHGGSR